MMKGFMAARFLLVGLGFSIVFGLDEPYFRRGACVVV